MRVDYTSYVVAIVCFILTVYTYGYPEPFGITNSFAKNLTITVLFLVGLAFIVAGYSQKPKTTPTPSPLEHPPTTISAPNLVAPSFKPSIDLTSVKGIGPKRAEKLRSAGIFTANDLIKATPEELAKKAKTSTKVSRK